MIDRQKEVDRYKWLLMDKDHRAYWSNTVFGLVIEILWHRFKCWKKDRLK